jgi:hypothetical protein
LRLFYAIRTEFQIEGEEGTGGIGVVCFGSDTKGVNYYRVYREEGFGDGGFQWKVYLQREQEMGYRWLSAVEYGAVCESLVSAEL